MNYLQAKELEKEYNELASKGTEMYSSLEIMGNRCNQILTELKESNFTFDELALLFGSELIIDEE
jgi:hypothetical protein